MKSEQTIHHALLREEIKVSGDKCRRTKDARQSKSPNRIRSSHILMSPELLKSCLD